MKRTGFLLGALSGLSVVANTDTIFSRALAQTALPGLPGGSDRILVVINFQGGNDGLNTVVPFGMPDYYRYRPSLGVAPNDVLRIDNTFGLNPVLAPFKKMYDGGNVAIVHGVGYPDPDHSHFRSTEIWQTAQPKGYESTGWVGRYLDDAGLPKANLFNAVAISNVLPEMLISKTTDVPVIDAVASYGLRSDKTKGNSEAFHEFVRDTTVPFRSPFLAQVAEIEDHAQRGAQELPKLIAGYQSQATYPTTPLGRGVKGGLYGRHPDLGQLNAGNLAFSTDFRNVYATVLERWLGRPSASIVGAGYTPLPSLLA